MNKNLISQQQIRGLPEIVQSIQNKVNDFGDTISGSINISGNLAVTGNSYLTGNLNLIGASNFENPSYPGLISTRFGTLSGAAGTAFAIMHRTQGEMVDGFGVGMIFLSQDATSTNHVGTISTSRRGADNSAQMNLIVRNSGGAFETGLIVDPMLREINLNQSYNFVANTGSIFLGESKESSIKNTGNGLEISGRTSFIGTSVPLSGSASGNQGEYAYDNNYIYVCISGNVWKRSSLSSF